MKNDINRIPDVLVELNCCGIFSGERTLFKDFNFTWRTGEHWGIVGPNGSGKSMLLRLISGSFYSPGCDVIFCFRGHNGGGPQGRIATVSMERQGQLLKSLEAYTQMRWNSIEEESSPTLSAWFSQDSIEELAPFEKKCRSNHSIAAFRHHREAVLTQMKLDDLLTRHIVELSSGEIRRALIARALLSKPKILLLDSPLIGLDAESQLIVGRNIDKIAEAGLIQTMFASVRSEELPPSTTHLLMFNGAGQVIEKGPIAQNSDLRTKTAYIHLPERPPSTPTSFEISGDSDPKTQPIIEMNNVTIHYGDHVVIRNLSWVVRKGERWLLTGPNGSGKTTLIALIIGDHLQAYSNTVSIFGKRRGRGDSIWDIKKRIGWVSPELHACIDVSQSVFSIVLSGFTDSTSAHGVYTLKKQDDSIKMLKKLNLAKHADVLFGSLSSGEQRLVLLARALVKKAPLLILDEPCQNLDAKNRKRLLDIIDSTCSNKSISLIYITHLKDSIPRCITHTIKAVRT